MPTTSRTFAASLFGLLLLHGRAAAPAAPAAAGAPVQGLANPLNSSHGCLISGNGYLRAKIRGALQLDIDLHNAELECDGGARPDGSGIRVSFAGPVRSDGRRLRIVFGLAGASEATAGRAIPTNVTVIFEGEERLFATRGDDKCTTDEVRQERIGSVDETTRSYRIVADGFCIAPVQALNGGSNIFLNSFDFAGRITFEPADR